MCSEASDTDNLSLDTKCQKVQNSVGSASQEDIRQIEELTVNQDKSDLWHTARYSCITASRCHEVMTRMVTLEGDVNQNSDNLIQRFIYPKNVCTGPMKKGKKWEEKAFHKYKEVTEKEHDNFRITKSGLVVGKHIFLGASSDGLIRCDCHGDGVLEIKCATKVWDKDPNSRDVIEQIPYLQTHNTELNKKYKYYSQVQFQTGITGRKWCHFIVFTGKRLANDVKPLIINADFDEALFESLVSASIKFWFGHLLLEILSKRLKNICEEDQKDNDMDYNITPEKSYVTDHMYALCLDSKASSGNNCPICHTLCKDEEDLSVFNERSIGSDICYAWFHFGCLKMTPKKLEEIS